MEVKLGFISGIENEMLMKDLELTDLKETTRLLDIRNEMLKMELHNLSEDYRCLTTLLKTVLGEKGPDVEITEYDRMRLVARQSVAVKNATAVAAKRNLRRSPIIFERDAMIVEQDAMRSAMGEGKLYVCPLLRGAQGQRKRAEVELKQAATCMQADEFETDNLYNRGDECLRLKFSDHRKRRDDAISALDFGDGKGSALS